MYTITKRFGPYPAAHRQHKHDGHCALIHGHNFVFDVSFSVPDETQLDANGFVLDFGKMELLKTKLVDLFDHTFLINQDDPRKLWFQRALGIPKVAKIVIVASGSAEGLAKLVYDLASITMLPPEYMVNRQVSVSSVTCFEDEKNSATYTPTLGQARTV